MSLVLFYITVAILLIMNTAAFYLMWKDRKNARHREKRIPERTIMLVSAFFGALGGCLAMYILHHKTRHLKFALGLPLLFLLQVYLILMLIGNRIIRFP